MYKIVAIHHSTRMGDLKSAMIFNPSGRYPGDIQISGETACIVFNHPSVSNIVKNFPFLSNIRKTGDTDDMIIIFIIYDDNRLKSLIHLVFGFPALKICNWATMHFKVAISKISSCVLKITENVRWDGI